MITAHSTKTGVCLPGSCIAIRQASAHLARGCFLEPETMHGFSHSSPVVRVEVVLGVE
jgi:hypothetical protein